MKKAKLSFIVLLLTAALAVSLTACGGSPDSGSTDKPVEWIAYSTWPESNHQSVALVEYAKRVEEATGGRVKITVHTGGSLGYKGTEILSVVRDNLVQISDMSMGNVAGEEAVFGITTLPFMLENMEQGYLLNKLARDDYDQLLESKWNQRILFTSPWPMAGFWTKKPINAIDDLKGVKMRTYDRNTGLVVGAVGGTPYPLPFADVYSSLATGAIDSCLTSAPTAVDAKFWEVLDYYTPTGVAMTQDMVTINLDEFNKLDKDTQDILLSVGDDMQKKMWEEVGPTMDAEMEKICVDHGIVAVPPTDEFIQALYDKTSSIREDWLASAPDAAKKIYEEFEKEAKPQK